MSNGLPRKKSSLGVDTLQLAKLNQISVVIARLDRAIQYSAASAFGQNGATGYWMPRFRGA